MQIGRFKVITAKLRRLIEIDEDEAIKGTIKFGRREREPDEAGNRFSRSPNFLIPVPPSERPVSAEGRVAFHFKHTFVVKKAHYSNSTALSTGTLVTSGDKESFTTDAGNHERYISRESAVAAITPGDYDAAPRRTCYPRITATSTIRALAQSRSWMRTSSPTA